MARGRHGDASFYLLVWLQRAAAERDLQASCSGGTFKRQEQNWAGPPRGREVNGQPQGLVLGVL